MDRMAHCYEIGNAYGELEGNSQGILQEVCQTALVVKATVE